MSPAECLLRLDERTTVGYRRFTADGSPQDTSKSNGNPRRERHLDCAGSGDDMVRPLPDTPATCDFSPSASPDESHARDTPPTARPETRTRVVPPDTTRGEVAKLPLRTRRPSPQRTTLCAPLPLSQPPSRQPSQGFSTHRNTRPFRARKDDRVGRYTAGSCSPSGVGIKRDVPRPVNPRHSEKSRDAPTCSK